MKSRLSMHLVNFAAEPPGTWQRIFDLAAAADRAGIGRLVGADHVVYGERLDRYADPARGGLAGGSQPTGPDGAWL
ncbi:MAG: LLM class F420-dependent oxidoreductase, partial [Acidimicrobiaceae bacterium]|nr:LLM class F420-dependent oxidoreductase [Acidimicrobiaceae bacterium]